MSSLSSNISKKNSFSFTFSFFLVPNISLKKKKIPTLRLPTFFLFIFSFYNFFLNKFVYHYFIIPQFVPSNKRFSNHSAAHVYLSKLLGSTRAFHFHMLKALENIRIRVADNFDGLGQSLLEDLLIINICYSK